MAGINHVVLLGNLVRDTELKYTNTGTAVSKFSLAVNRRIKRGEEWVEEVNYFDIVVWGRTAEALSQYLTKGKQVAVEGELRQNRWEDKETGKTRSKVEISASNIQLLGGAKGAGGTATRPAENYQPQSTATTDDFEDDIPF